MVLAQLNSFWGKAVGHTKERPRISATLVRKSVSSKVRTQKPELGKDLADLCHSEDTAKRSYFFQEKTKKRGSTSATLQSVLREDVKATSD